MSRQIKKVSESFSVNLCIGKLLRTTDKLFIIVEGQYDQSR